MDTKLLAVFDEVYKTRSVSRAAQHLGLAQASASIVLNKLRHHFGDRLFSRTSAGMEPTPRALAIHADIVEALARLDRARGSAEGFDAATAQREFRLCMTDISEIVLLPRLVNHLRRVAPGLTLSTEKIAPESPRRLESGEVDLAIGFTPDLEAGFYQQALFAQNFVCLAAAQHPRIRNKLTQRQFAEEGHVVVSTAGTGHAIVDKVLARHKLERRAVLRVPSFLGVARIVAQTELIVVVPRLLGQAVAQQERVQLLEPPVPLPDYKVKQHWHQRFHADAGNAWLRRAVAELFSGLGTAGGSTQAAAGENAGATQPKPASRPSRASPRPTTRRTP